MTFKLRGEPRKLQTSIILEAYTLAAVEACEDPILAQGIREQGRTGPWFAFAPHANLLSILEHHTGVVTARDENDDPVIFDLKVDRFKPEQSQPPRAHDKPGAGRTCRARKDGDTVAVRAVAPVK